jgi:hypothetical protein
MMLQFVVWRCASGVNMLVQRAPTYDTVWGYHRLVRYL